MFQLDLEKAEEPEFKLPKCIGSLKKQESSRKKNICFIDYAKDFDCVDHSKLRKILKEMGIPDHLTCLLRNLYAGQEATIRTRQGTTDQFQIGKRVHQCCILSPCLFNLNADYTMWNSGLDEVQFSLVQLLSHVQLFVTPWIAARQASLSVTISRSSLKLTSIKSVMPSSHLILCHPLFLLPPTPLSIRVFPVS